MPLRPDPGDAPPANAGHAEGTARPSQLRISTHGSNATLTSEANPTVLFVI